jgi:dipeptidyl aminopeptidase/acylaminoacyl peptidase
MQVVTRWSFALLAAISPLTAHAQKKALTQADWDRWRSIQGATLSNDGKWVAYTLSPQVGDGEFVVRSTAGTTEYRVPVGYIGRANNIPGGLRPPAPAGAGGRGGRAGGAGTGTGGPFNATSKFAFVTTQPNKAEVERAQRAAKAKRAATAGPVAPDSAAANRTSLVLISLVDGKQTTIADARNVRVPKDNGTWLIYSPISDSLARAGDTTATGRAGGGGRGGRGGAAAVAPGARRAFGNAIVLRNLETGAEERIADVLSYTFDDSAKVLAYSVASRDSTRDGMYLRNMSTGALKTLASGRGNYRDFTFDRAQQQFAFTSDHDDFGKPKAHSTLFLGTMKTGTAAAVSSTAALPAGMHLADNANISFARNGGTLQFNIAPPPDDTVPTDSLVGKAQFDLWNYKDAQLQPTQKLQVARDRNPTYSAVYQIASRKLVQLTTDSMPSISLSDDGKLALASTSVAYNIERMWGDGGNDVYVLDANAGTRRLIAEKISGTAQLSVDGKYVIFWDKGKWHTYNLATSKTVDVTSAAKGVRFDEETWSTPNEPAPWGIAGWTKGDKSVLIYDRFDIWEIDPAGVKAPVVVTDSVGRRESLTFRIVDLDQNDDRAIDPAKPLLLHAFSTVTKGSGFYRDRLNTKMAPEKIVFADVAYGAPQKARDAEEYLVTKSTFIEFPNLWVGPSLTSLTKVSDANPWQSEYNWGTAELVTWKSLDGKPLQGILYKPENFDPTKKYPMISYFYEDLSDGLNNYVPPTGRNVINPTHYVSNGYLVFEPDIYYEIGYPGPSALKSIVPGVQKLLERGYVDPKGLGLQGQSWGGYQAAYIITQSSMFSAAMAGAPVANMTSAYGGIRWGTGISRTGQYENGQSRIGKNLWDAQSLYIENSPLFWLPRVKTPLFIMSNDADDAVPWYQGIELFVGMRRLGKEAYLIDYNNDVHNPASRANQKDIAMRMQQFFDNKLMGKPAPDWMVKGIPAKDKGKDQVAPIIRPQ